MNKTEVIAHVAEMTGHPKTVVRAVVSALFDTDGVIATNLAQGDGVVNIAGFGSWKRVERKARTGRNPQTQEIIKIPAKTSCRASISKAIKDFVLSAAPKKRR